jgi:hypothetical protein
VSRTEKLFQRLDELEAEYRRLAAHEFARWVHNQGYAGWSLFLVDKIPFLYSLRYPAASERQRLDEILHVEREIETLRHKLDQPISESSVHAVRDAAARICTAHEAGEATEMMLAKTLLKDLGHEELIKQQ